MTIRDFDRICKTCSCNFKGKKDSNFCSYECTSKVSRKYKERTCRGCGLEFKPHNSRHWTCPSCSENRSLQTRVYRYGESGINIKSFLSEKDGLCILCDREAKCIDHDHKTGKVRGALCHGCNRSLSYLERDGWLEKALEYLKRGKKE